jgi:hypothetical protein
MRFTINFTQKNHFDAAPAPTQSTVRIVQSLTMPIRLKYKILQLFLFSWMVAIIVVNMNEEAIETILGIPVRNCKKTVLQK